jgi:hypothetical protein
MIQMNIPSEDELGDQDPEQLLDEIYSIIKGFIVYHQNCYRWSTLNDHDMGLRCLHVTPIIYIRPQRSVVVNSIAGSARLCHRPIIQYFVICFI